MKSSVKEIQTKILEIIKYMHELCVENSIQYCIMGGTALGAVRHGGFIPWDDDLDVFMTPSNYLKFKVVFEKKNDERFYLQEFKTNKKYLEYAKVRMNGTTFIEKEFIKEKNMHQGIFVDIMILHKVSTKRFVQKLVYFDSKLVTLIGRSFNHWNPRNIFKKFANALIKLTPRRLISLVCFNRIYKYDSFTNNYYYCYWITKASFKEGLFKRDFFDSVKLVKFEDTELYAPNSINEYLTYRYGDYMKVPPVEKQRADVHAIYADVNHDWRDYFKDENK